MAIYLVTTQTSPVTTRIVEAKNKHAALNHVIKDLFSVSSMSASEVVEHMRAGIDVETAQQKESIVEREAASEGSNFPM